ncbi:hypothetical protein L6164_036614 [Bauhinia variegata]|uniref:Uncharacterized protein n=1 Tax=Bauhinia variegata TaxID=167791 RepID=A0ACB9KHK5_BAUVA|nr:hypothetical protein L6164_036614 [Bauhinia variegata]
MDSRAILDYALFQLTPTRTRCELVVFSGAVNEKIASGLFEPFVAHLKFVKDEISKGGYSIKLLPPTKAAPWFSKATFERFVRFVSTPAVLERFVIIEREILQIESSFQATPVEGLMSSPSGDTRKSSDSTKLKEDFEGANNKEEENSKISLQRLLESRIALLRKEQAMAYARGRVAGFEIANIDDLIHFANAFEAFRLREACINFKELWKKKRADDLWIKELAAAESCLPPALSFSTSGIILANEPSVLDENNNTNYYKDTISAGDVQNGSMETSNIKQDDNLPASDQIPKNATNAQIPMPWPYNLPPYMYNLQGPLQQMPSYQGYPLANMQSVPPYMVKHMQWPTNLDNSGLSPEDSNYHKKQKPRATKKERSHKGAEDFKDSPTESTDPDSGSESNSDKQQDAEDSLMDDGKRKKHSRKSSRTVVIRNINYITPKRRNGSVSDEASGDDDFIYEDSIKRNVNAALESLQKVHQVHKHANGKIRKPRHIVSKSSDDADQDLNENRSADASEEGNKKEDWSAFQNLLKIDEKTENDGAERQQPIDVEDEHFAIRDSEENISYAASISPDLDFKEVSRKPKIANDSFIVTGRDGENEGRAKLEEYVDSCGPVTKSRDNLGEEMLISHKIEEPRIDPDDPLSTYIERPSINKCRNAEDWFVVEHSENTVSPDSTIVPKVFDGDCIVSSVDVSYGAEKRNEGTLIDDSFMIQSQLVDNNLSDSKWNTDIDIVADLTSASNLENDIASSHGKHELSKNQEPSDLCVVLQRDSGLDSVETSWTMDYEIDFSFSETGRRSYIDSSQDNVDKKFSDSPKKTDMSKSKVPGMKNSGKEDKSKASRGSLVKGKSEIISRNMTSSAIKRPVVQKSKLEKEEEMRKKMEELVIERQRRIAERTAAARGLGGATSKTEQLGSKTARGSNKTDKKEMSRISSVKVRAV